MPVSLVESQAINELARALYGFLPGKPHPYANQQISFPGVAGEAGVAEFWPQGSKLPAITMLLEQTFGRRMERFCPLILGIVKRGLVYRGNKGDDCTKQELEAINGMLKSLGFKIPELWDPAFLESLPASSRIRKQSKNVSLNRSVQTSKPSC